MEIENLVQAKVLAFMGQKSSTSHSLLNDAECEEVKNFVTRRSRLRKIWGAVLYVETAFGLGEIKWLDYFRKRWIFQRGSSIGVETGELTKVFFELGFIIGGETQRVFSDIWTDLLFLSNGFENRFIDFNTLSGPAIPVLFRVGLLPPGGGVIVDGGPYVAAGVTVVDNLSSNLEVGAYRYLVTLWDDVRRVESFPYGSFVGEDGLWLLDQSNNNNYLMGGLVVNVAAVNKEVRIDLTNIFALGFDTDRVTHYIIYRQDSDGTYKRVPVISGTTEDKTLIASKVFHDTVAVAELGQVLDLSISPPPSGKYYRDSSAVAQTNNYGPRFVKFFRDQLWFFGVNFPGTVNGFDIAESKIVRFYPLNGIAYGSDVGNFDYWKYSYSIGRETGQRDTFMGIHRNTLLFFKEGSAYYLDGTSPDNYEVRGLDDKRGISVSGSAQETTIGIIGLGAEGFTLFDSISGGKIISEDIADMVEKINLEHQDKITSSFDPGEEKYECHCPIENTYNTLVFVYDCKLLQWSFTKKAGAATAYGLTTNKRIVGLIGDKQNGRLYTSTDRSATTFNGQTMHGIWRSRQFDFGYPGKLKSLQLVTIVARAKRDFRLSIDVVPDFAQNDAVSINDIDPDARKDVLAESAQDPEGMDWDEGQWSNGTEKKEFTILVQSIGKRLQLIVRNSDTDADRANFEIEEIILWASLLDGDKTQ